MTPLNVRPSTPADIPAITTIYTHHVLHGTASFEEQPPSETEMAARRAAVLEEDYPHIVAERDGVVVGYAYLSKFRPRPAYRHTTENSVYVAHDAVRQGIGRALLVELIARAEVGPWTQMMAVISDLYSGSEQIHAAFGFRKVGHMEKIGFKFGNWIDVIVMQRGIG